MRTVSRITKDMRRRRAYRLTQRWQLAERTRLHEAEIQAEADAFARFERALDSVVLARRKAPLPLETMDRIWSYLAKGA